MRYLRLINVFIEVSFQEAAAYRANFWISLLHSVLNLITGVLGIAVLFNQTQNLNGWTFQGTLAVLGVYLTVGGLRSLFIGPSLDALAGMDGEVWSGKLDFTLLRPVDVQFLASFRKWRLFALFDILLGLGALAAALIHMNQSLPATHLAAFIVTLFSSMLILYAVLLLFSALVFWSPGVLFTWIFDGILQMARYPVGIYPAWLRFVLTWIVPVGLITTIPAEALTGTISSAMLAGSLTFAIALTAGASLFFRFALRRYSSASS